MNHTSKGNMKRECECTCHLDARNWLLGGVEYCSKCIRNHCQPKDQDELRKKIEERIYSAMINEEFQYNDYQRIVDDLLDLVRRVK